MTKPEAEICTVLGCIEVPPMATMIQTAGYSLSQCALFCPAHGRPVAGLYLISFCNVHELLLGCFLLRAITRHFVRVRDPG